MSEPCACERCTRHRNALRDYRAERERDNLSRATLLAALRASRISVEPEQA